MASEPLVFPFSPISHTNSNPSSPSRRRRAPPARVSCSATRRSQWPHPASAAKPGPPPAARAPPSLLSAWAPPPRLPPPLLPLLHPSPWFAPPPRPSPQFTRPPRPSPLLARLPLPSHPLARPTLLLPPPRASRALGPSSPPRLQSLALLLPRPCPYPYPQRARQLLPALLLPRVSRALAPRSTQARLPPPVATWLGIFSPSRGDV